MGKRILPKLMAGLLPIMWCAGTCSEVMAHHAEQVSDAVTPIGSI
jgi:hypothetical protein